MFCSVNPMCDTLHFFQDERSNSDNEDLALEDHEDGDEEELLKQSEKLRRQM